MNLSRLNNIKDQLEDARQWNERIAKVGASALDRERAEENLAEIEIALNAVRGDISNYSNLRNQLFIKIMIITVAIGGAAVLGYFLFRN